MKKGIIGVFVVLTCAANLVASGGIEPVETDGGFPDFITSNDDYYVTRIGNIPEIDPATYRLEVTGLIDTPTDFSLEELYAMDMKELPLTVECIGNSPNGPLLSTAIWKGVLLADFLEALGIDDAATGVKYMAADGYYASHTLEQITENGVLLALYMNGEPIPPLHGYPIRILNPGYYGVKQPAWVTSIEVIDRPLEDYWDDRGWDVSPPMAIDSTIFSPDGRVTIGPGEPLHVTGAAFGGRRVAKVEVTTDYGETWTEANIVERADADNTWVFWETELVFEQRGSYGVNIRATDIAGNTQAENDPIRLDGNNDWPILRVTVK